MTRRAYCKWTEEQDDMIRQMFTAGCGVDEMARVLNRPVTHIRTRLYALDLRLSDRTVEPDREEFKRVMALRLGDAP